MPNGLDSLANAWAVWMSAMSWQVVILAAVVLLITETMRKGPASLRYALWGLVLLKLLLPPALGTPWSVGTVTERLGGVTVPAPASAPAPQLSGEAIASEPVAFTPTEERVVESGRQLAPMRAVYGQLSLAEKLFLVWLTGAIGFAALILIQYWRYRRRVFASLSEPSAELLRLFEEQHALLRVRGSVRLLLSDAVTTPAVFGAWRPSILLPADSVERFSDSELRFVLAHELAHVRRGDLALGWAAAALTCLYWFHPLVWLVNAQLRREREMACDDLVLKTTKQDGERYASTILRVAESFKGWVPTGAGVLGLIELYDHLLHRVRSATDERRVRRMGWKAAPWLLTVALVTPMGVWQSSGAMADQEESAEAQAAAPADDTSAATNLEAAVDAEIAAHYSETHPEVQEFVRRTAVSFGRSDLWLPEGALGSLTADERNEKVEYLATLLEESQYGRHLCEGLAQAGALKDERLMPGLKKVAAYHLDDRDYDCRPKWMAVAALARQEDESAVPVLVPLVDHGNMNTRLWARAALARITDESFGDDKQAWADWWNGTGYTPALGPEAVKPWTPPVQVAQATQTTSVRPVIVSTVPEIGSSAVHPDTTELRVTFDQDMAGGFSWTGGGDAYPEIAAKPSWIDRRTCVLPVKLQPGKFYRVGINAPSFQNFKSADGMPVKPTAFWFVTADAAGRPVDTLQPPKVVSFEPGNGVAAVPADVSELVVTFDRKMAEGFSWTDPEGKMPATSAKPYWREDGMTCVLPVTLESGREYVTSLNYGWYINFKSAEGVPVAPVRYSFSTAE